MQEIFNLMLARLAGLATLLRIAYGQTNTNQTKTTKTMKNDSWPENLWESYNRKCDAFLTMRKAKTKKDLKASKAAFNDALDVFNSIMWPYVTDEGGKIDQDFYNLTIDDLFRTRVEGLEK